MAKIFEAHGLGPASGVRRGRAGRRRSIRDSIRPRRISRATCFPRPTRCRADTDAAKLVRLMVARLRARASTPELRQAAAARGLTVRQARDARVDCREGDARGRRAAAGGGRLRESAAHRDGAAVRSDGDLRAAARGALRRQPAPGRSVVRLAVQHVSLPGSAAGADRLAGPRVARGGRASGGRPTTSTSSAATTARTSSRARSTSTTATCRSTRCSTSGIKQVRREA